jgi:hypothetical protein
LSSLTPQSNRTRVNGEAMTTDRHLARRVAAAHELPGVPVSMRSKADLPGAGVGAGHWARRVAALAAEVDRARRVGHALLPDDDHTETDGTLPGDTPVLRGAAAEIDARLADAISHLAALTVAVERLAAALGGQADAEAVRAELATLHADEPDERA